MNERDFPSWRHAYLSLMCDRIQAGDVAVRARALAVMDLWREQPDMDRWLLETWSRLLDAPVENMRTAVLENSDSGDRLRHSFPFAGILGNRERMELRRRYG